MVQNKKVDEKFLKNKKVDEKFLKNKKAQFYLVAAIIIVMILFGIASIKTYAIVREEPRKIKDISSELKEETSRIIDYGIYSDSDLTVLLNSFDEEFSEYFLKKTEETNIVFIYGNAEELYSVQYSNQYTGAVFATIGGSSPTWDTSEPIIDRTDISTEVVNDNVKINILDREFDFIIREGEVFYFLITQQRDDEIFIERN
tara:strand:- start:227 stop:829 length:603 start_codon:yes stop_codon:yes gene_type:complete